MKFQIVGVLALTFFSVNLFAAKAQADCAGCAPLILLEAKYSKLDPKDDDRVVELSNASSKAISELPTGKKQKLTPDQMSEVAKLLIASHPTDPEDALIDNNIELFNANKVAFFEIFKKFPASEAEDLRISLDTKLGEFYNGNDPEAVPAKRRK